MSVFIEPFKTSNDDLELLGGKGRSLTNLVNNRFQVPIGFHVTANAYRDFVSQNDLQPRILARAKPILNNGQASFEQASREIQALFEESTVSTELDREIKAAYDGLEQDQPAVAVRSSANAEDLPNLSFAGQQETYLNIRGSAEVAAAVKKCWASLWTPQALNYRHQNGIAQESVAMSVVVQSLIPSDVAGILFTANPATGERSEMVINASYGLGEAVVSGQITPDTYIVSRADGSIKESMIGTKELQIDATDGQGTVNHEVSSELQSCSVLSDEQVRELWEIAEKVVNLYDNVPQDIEWAICDGEIHLLQSRPITNLPVQPIEVEWEVPKPATYVSRRQIVENMPDPISPLFEELYLTEGLESARKDQSLMVGGGPMFIAVNGYAYQRFDFQMVHDQAREKGLLPVDDAEIDAAELAAQKQQVSAAHGGKTDKKKQNELERMIKEARERDLMVRERDIALFREDLSSADQEAFDTWRTAETSEDIALRITMPESKNPTYVAFNSSEWNDRQLGEWFKVTRPRLQTIREKWSKVNPKTASDEELLDGIQEMGIEEGYYWSSNASHTFGVAKSTDDQLQTFLRETLPDHHFISGQFLSGIESKTMEANAALFEIAKEIRKSEDLSFFVQVTPIRFLRDRLQERNDAAKVNELIAAYLTTYGHQGYSMDFFEPTQVEDPAAMMTTLKAMVGDSDYHPRNQEMRTKTIREEKFKEISELLSGMTYWQFRFRLWLAKKYHYIREEVAFMFGFTWGVLRPMAHELGSRLVSVGTLQVPSDVYFLATAELRQAIERSSRNVGVPELGDLAAERKELREARKRHHPPGTLPMEASQIDGIAFKETQIKNEADSAMMRGFPVSPGRVTAPASVVTSAAEFENMAPGSILVSPLTTPAWTQLFAHAVGLVTDVGSILAHGSIVAREYGIPAVLGVGDGTKRIKHGQMISIDGDQGTVEIHDE
ncbi:MAG: PEP-utilizing enzyme [Gammaproteobacteria bacterium]|nr:PEP-utilizing enzyme [Gammaproteobacteria bacterium]